MVFLFFAAPRVSDLLKPERQFFATGTVTPEGEPIFFVAEEKEFAFFVPSLNRTDYFSIASMEKVILVDVRPPYGSPSTQFFWSPYQRQFFRVDPDPDTRPTRLSPVSDSWDLLWPVVTAIK